MLKTVNLHKTFFQGVETKVIKGIDLEIQKKEFVMITGKSGSGKTTLLYLLSGLERPSEGNVFFEGEDIGQYNDKKMSMIRRRNFGFIFQFYNLVPSLKVWDNICLPIEMEHKLSKEEKDQILHYTKTLEIDDKLDSFPHQLSGGQQQRVAIARALAIEPDIIFADEPTGNLDTNTGDEVLKIFETLNKEHGKTIVMVTHDHTIGERFATRKIVVSNGKIVEKM